MVWGNDDDIGEIAIAFFGDGFAKERDGGKVIDEAREEALDLGSMEIDGDDAVDAGGGQ